MKNRTRILTAAVVMTACIATLAQRDQNVRPAKPGEVPFVYNASDYESVEIESGPKSVARPGHWRSSDATVVLTVRPQSGLV